MCDENNENLQNTEEDPYAPNDNEGYIVQKENKRTNERK